MPVGDVSERWIGGWPHGYRCSCANGERCAACQRRDDQWDRRMVVLRSGVKVIIPERLVDESHSRKLRHIAVALKGMGRSYGKIAELFGTSAGYVRKLYFQGLKAEEREKFPDTVDANLSTRARNSLRRLGVPHTAKREEVANIWEKVLSSVDCASPSKVYGLGSETLDEIRGWVFGCGECGGCRYLIALNLERSQGIYSHGMKPWPCERNGSWLVEDEGPCL